MTRFVVALFFALSTFACVPGLTAFACEPDISPEDDRAWTAKSIFAGRVLDSEHVVTQIIEGRSVSLRKLTVHVGEGYKGDAASDELVSVYVVTEAAVDESNSADPGVDLSMVVPASLPAMPELLSEYVFYAKTFEGESFVLVSNDDWYMREATEHEISVARAAVSMQGFPIH